MLVVYTTQLSTFVRRDIKILSKHFSVKAVLSNSIRSMLKIIREIPRSDVCYVWFGTMTAAIVVFFAKLFRKKSIVVAGGLDVANEPDIRYGLVNRRLYRFFPRFAFRYADIVLPFSENAQKELLNISKPKNHRIVYLGVEKTSFIPKGPKENIVLTVGAVNINTLQRKGIENFVRASSYLPEVPFYLVGKTDPVALEYLQLFLPDNLEIKGFLSEEELLYLYQKAKVYVQISKHEGFGVSLAEAMLCECIPVVTKCGAIPEVVGDTGIYVHYGDPKETAKAIQKAFEMERSPAARARILKNFSMERRERNITQIISECFKTN